MHWNHVILLAAASLGWAATAAAQEVMPAEPPILAQPTLPEQAPSRGLDRFVPAPTNAFELGVGFGYNQPLGSIEPGISAGSLAGAGGQFELDLGYRVAPEFLIGLYGTGSKFSTGNGVTTGADIWSSTVGVEGQWHFRPVRGLDPWVSLGTGFRGMWVKESDIGTSARLGWEIARARVGLDFRINEQVAISPVIGADVSMFLSGEPAGANTFTAIPGHLNTFVFAGINGRFDIGGQTTNNGRFMAKR